MHDDGGTEGRKNVMSRLTSNSNFFIAPHIPPPPPPLKTLKHLEYL
jgi:hypothetical protein